MAGQKGKGPLRIAIEDFLDTFGFGKRILDGLRTTLGEASSEVKPDLTKILNRIISGEDDGLDALIDYIGSSPESVIEKAFSSVAIIWSAMSLMMPGALTPVIKKLLYNVDRSQLSWRPDPAAIQQMAWRHPQLAEKILDMRYDLGMEPQMAAVFGDAIRPRAPEGTLLTAWFRGLMSEPELRDELQARGYPSEDVENIIQSAPIIPQIQDLIRMAVREAFRDDIAERFQYDADFPQDVVQWAEKQGLSEQWVRYFWRAHWELPSVTAAFEMLHRLRPGVSETPFTADDMETLLRTADIPAFFRERLIAISYSPFTRVDIRRMYRYGVLSREQVLDSYKDIGYDDWHAEKLTDFTIADDLEPEREATKAEIAAAYKREVLTRDEASAALQAIGYPLDLVEMVLATMDYDKAKGLIQDELDRVEFLYMEGELDQGGVYAELGPLNLPATQIAGLLVQWDIKLRKRRQLPSKTDLETWYRQALVDQVQLQAGLRARGYIAEDVEQYTKSIDIELAERAAAEAERAQKEQERIEAAELRTEFQRSKASIDVELANANLAIADLRLAIYDMVDEDQIVNANREILTLKDHMASLRVQKAGVHLEGI